MLEELIIQVKCIYIIIGVLEAGDHYKYRYKYRLQSS